MVLGVPILKHFRVLTVWFEPVLYMADVTSEGSDQTAL